MELSKYIAVLCEGSAEQAIMNVLLDNRCLIFEREELIEEEVLRIRKARIFETKYLRKSYDDKISIIRILDSKNESFNLSREYQDKVNVINIITAPEIEMLIIISEGKYDEYKRSRKKPSIFCKENLRISRVKNYDFVYAYFENPEKLILAIKEYHRIAPFRRGEYTLKDLIK